MKEGNVLEKAEDHSTAENVGVHDSWNEYQSKEEGKESTTVTMSP
jgi:hypothetical protein